jgi:hypothetical protein
MNRTRELRDEESTTEKRTVGKMIYCTQALLGFCLLVWFGQVVQYRVKQEGRHVAVVGQSLGRAAEHPGT